MHNEQPQLTMQQQLVDLSKAERSLQELLTSNEGALKLTLLGAKLGSGWQESYGLPKSLKLTNLLAKLPGLLQTVDDQKNDHVKWVVLSKRLLEPILLDKIRSIRGQLTQHDVTYTDLKGKLHKYCPLEVLARAMGHSSVKEMLGLHGLVFREEGAPSPLPGNTPQPEIAHAPASTILSPVDGAAPAIVTGDREEAWTVCSNCFVHEDVEDMRYIIDKLPAPIYRALTQSNLKELIEIIMDLGRHPRARFAGSDGVMRFQDLCRDTITATDLESFCGSISDFDHENRAGISNTLHRISRLQNREGKVVGLTVRVGKAIRGLVEMIRDVLEEAAASKSSILLLGAPGMGKTSVIREMARVLADDEAKSVMIVDTSNEIAGDGDVPHPAIGSARRMQVPEAAMQHKRMIEAVQNHTPDVIIVDEIGTRDESAACCTIARRGVMLIATAHGVTLKDVVDNPSLNSVLGGIESVVLGDKAMEERQLKQKTVREAKGPSAFKIAIELRSRTEWIVHRNVRENVNSILEDKPVLVEKRWRSDEGLVMATRKLISYSNDQPSHQDEAL